MTRTSDAPQLDRIAIAVRDRVRIAAGAMPMTFTCFHGFRKSRLPNEILGEVLEQFDLTSEMVQVEIAEVLTDLRHAVHIHERTEAHVTCIGEDFGLQNPHDGYAFMHNRWLPIKLGDVLQIPKHVAHGFTVGPGGVLYLLSVQNPPLVSPDGHEDYIAQSFTRWSQGDLLL